MNRRESLRALAYLNAAWPYVELPEETIEVWVEHLDRVDPDVGQVAAFRCVNEDERFPSIARFLEYVKAATPRKTYAELQAAEEDLGDPESIAKVIEMTRHMLKKV